MKMLRILTWFLAVLVLPVAAQAKMFLPDANTSLELVTASSVSTIFSSCSYADITSTTVAMGATDTAITTATTTTIVAAPGASTGRQIKGCTFRNSHASSSNLITLQRDVSATNTQIVAYTLLAGETLQWDEDGGFRVITSGGAIRTTIVFNTPNGDTMVDDTNDGLRVTGVTVQAVSGNVAHDSAESQSPVVIGGHASSTVNGETIVANGDAVRAHFGRDGVQHVRTGCALEDIVSAVVTATAGANTSGIAAQGAGIKVYLSQVIIYNNGASNGSMIVTDGSGGTTKLKLPFPASTGTTVNLALPVGFTANTAIFVDPTGSDNIDVTLIGCKSQL